MTNINSRNIIYQIKENIYKYYDISPGKAVVRMPIVELKNIHKTFGKNEVLKGIDLNVEKGDVVAVIGPSGTGKTTLLRCINFLERPTEGEITVGGLTLNCRHTSKADIIALRKKTAMVFQNYNLFKNKTALENVMEGLVAVQKKPKDEAREMSLTQLDKVGLKDKINAYASQLSGGQQQRVGIARALVMKPEVILFDEPTSALDAELVGEVLTVIRDVARSGITMIIVTHEIRFAQNVSGRVVFMDDGRIIEQGKPNEIFLHPKEERTQRFLSRINLDFSYDI